MAAYRLVRWIGDPSPFSDPKILRDIMTSQLPLALANRFTEFDRRQRVCAIPGKSELTLGPSHGFSRTYRFGPQQFAQYMTAEDAARLFANEWDRWQFLDVTDTPEQRERPALSGRQWQALLASFAKLTDRRRLRPEFR